MTKTTKKAPVAFTDAEKDALRAAAKAVFDECAYDLLQAVAEENPRREPTIPRAEAIEVALDAGRPEEQLRRMKSLAPEALAALIEKFNAADYAQLVAIVKPAFPFARYGL